MIDDLLLLARSEQPQFLCVETIDLPAFISEIWEPIGMLAQRRFELAGVPRGALEADPGRLARVWAEQARTGGARIVIELPGFSPAETTGHPPTRHSPPTGSTIATILG